MPLEKVLQLWLKATAVLKAILSISFDLDELEGKPYLIWFQPVVGFSAFPLRLGPLKSFTCTTGCERLTTSLRF